MWEVFSETNRSISKMYACTNRSQSILRRAECAFHGSQVEASHAKDRMIS